MLLLLKVEWYSLRDKCIIQKPFQALAKARLEDVYRSTHTEGTISMLVAYFYRMH